MSFKSVNEFDVVFISYDENNCEENWADLENKVPWAKRVHGVKGSDAAHKAAAKLAETDMFITVDADNIVDTSFFNLELNLEDPKLKGKTISWSAQNYINGLEYGNGGLKLWPKEHVLNMKTHEHSDSTDPRSQIEFCWDTNYIQMTNQYSVTYPNGSPQQAFRAGFREGVKMSLDQGKKVTPEEFKKKIWWGNYKRLITWCSVGADVENGLWAMYGARLGCYMTTLTDWDYINVRDFDYLNTLFEAEKQKFEARSGKISNSVIKCYKTNYTWDSDVLWKGISTLGESLRKGAGLEVAELDEIQSRFYKAAYINVPRMNRMFTETELNELRRLNK
jgi:hypothetical protein